MTDLVERLRGRSNALDAYHDLDEMRLLNEAADEIERLLRRVIALEQMISEEMEDWDACDEANQMLILTAHEAHARRKT
jgi:hypothetical protein